MGKSTLNEVAMNSKDEVLHSLETVIEEYGLNKTDVGLAISGSRSFMELMRDPDKSITTNTIDKVRRFVLQVRGQRELPL